jgi:NarL family two-component system response regulator LiaR
MMGNRPFRLILVTDQEMIFHSLALFTEVYTDIELIGNAVTLKEALCLSAERGPDLFLVDWALHSVDATALVRTISMQYPTVPVIVLVSSLDEKVSDVMFAARARACLDKLVPNIDQIAETIRSLCPYSKLAEDKRMINSAITKHSPLIKPTAKAWV